MNQIYGMEMPQGHVPAVHRAPARYLVTIDAGGSMVARLFLANRELVGEFDAAVAEVGIMTAGLVPELGALGAEWNDALQSHSAEERAGAEVFTLSI
jgi:hypothetical protein